MSDKRDGHPASGATRTRHVATPAMRRDGPRPAVNGAVPLTGQRTRRLKPSGQSSSCRSPSPGRSFRERKPHEHRSEVNPHAAMGRCHLVLPSVLLPARRGRTAENRLDADLA